MSPYVISTPLAVTFAVAFGLVIGVAITRTIAPKARRGRVAGLAGTADSHESIPPVGWYFHLGFQPSALASITDGETRDSANAAGL